MGQSPASVTGRDSTEEHRRRGQGVGEEWGRIMPGEAVIPALLPAQPDHVRQRQRKYLFISGLVLLTFNNNRSLLCRYKRDARCCEDERSPSNPGQ